MYIYWETSPKNTERCSVNLLRYVLKGVLKTDEKFSVKLLTNILKNTENNVENNFIVKTQGLGLFPVTSWLHHGLLFLEVKR